MHLPADKLVPTITLRLNYLHFIEDILSHLNIKDPVTGIDIGCGASCVYCLLGVRMNELWKMFALEIDDENIEHARGNVKRNQLDDRITVVPQDGSKAIFDKLFELYPQSKTFCLCNPPFFKNTEEVLSASNRTGKRKAPISSNSGGSPHELIFQEGGELGFVKKIFTESVQLEDKIEIYSTMLGCKKNFLKFLNELKSSNVHKFTTTEFVQGKITRWGVAWSFKHDLRTFRKSQPTVDKLQPAQTSRHILKHELTMTNFEETVNQLRTTFDDLKIEVKVIQEQVDKFYRWELTARKNTWSNQRRKKRAEQRNEELTNGETSSNNLLMWFEIRNCNEKADMTMFFVSGNMNKDCVNQILQFIKNKFGAQ